MKTEKRRQEKRKATTRELIGITAILKDGIKTKQGDLILYLLKPTNIAVLSDASTEARVAALADVLKGFPDIEMLCLNSREDFEGNKRFLLERLAAEPVPAVKRLLEQDLAWLDTVQSQMATSREFALALRLSGDMAASSAKPPSKPERIPYKAGKGTEKPASTAQPPTSSKPAKRPAKANLVLARLEKALKGRGFAVRLADGQEIMRLLAVYFAQNVTTERFDTYDGERFGLSPT